ncbi:hypothetical protein [Salinispora oceanensis]|uniref:hypothetical protein n=1 Tax=Salinispora oceanensis TaxID=1050199 RepID=UPI000367E145
MSAPPSRSGPPAQEADGDRPTASVPAVEQPPGASKAVRDDQPEPPAEPGPRPVVDQPTPAPEEWSGPSWGAEWAPGQAGAESLPASRRARVEPDGWDGSEPSGHRARAEPDGWDEPEPPGRRARVEPDGGDGPEPPGHRARVEPDGWDEPEPAGRRFRGGTPRDAAGERRETSGRRFRPDPDETEAGEGGQPSVERPAWAVEPQRAYEPVRAEPASTFPTEPGRRSGIRPERQPASESDHQPPDAPAAWAPAQPAASAEAGPPLTASARGGLGDWDRTPAEPIPTSTPPYSARRSVPEPAVPAPLADADRQPESMSAMLPQRVPAEPDVPVVPEPSAAEVRAKTPELARIATHLRQADESAPPRERPEGFDVDAILGAVRGVTGVRDAALRRTQSGAHSLRLDLADGADPAEVSRHVARLLQERLGLAAAPQHISEGLADVMSPAHRQSAGPVAPAGRPPTGLPSRTERQDAARSEPPRRRRHSGGPHRVRSATVDGPAAAVGGAADGPATAETSYGGGQVGMTELAPSRPLDTGGRPGPRVVLDHVQVSTFGLDATVEVRLLAAGSPAAGYATGPAVDGYMLRLSAAAAAAAVDQLLRAPGPQPDRGRCFVEHATLVPLGTCEVATVVVLLVCDGWVEQLAGSALVAGDPRQAVVRATLAAVNRRLEALLADTGDAG